MSLNSLTNNHDLSVDENNPDCYFVCNRAVIPCDGFHASLTRPERSCCKLTFFTAACWPACRCRHAPDSRVKSELNPCRC